jgi:glycosyltransferase involved in cell wall biosynthesis
MIYIFCSIALFVLYGLLILLYCVGWSKQRLSKLPENYVPNTKITVIIPARNEESNIAPCLHSILHNSYPQSLLEIIVADDFSTDATVAIAKKILASKNAGYVLQLSSFISAHDRLNSYKKKALELAIAQAGDSLIVTTDADCTVPPHWLAHIAHTYELRNAQFIVAPVNFLPPENSKGKGLLYLFQSLDFMTMQGITAASSRLNLGNMCNGANLAFTKSAFDAVNGYKDIDHIASGDDMLLMYKINKAFPGQIYYLKNTAAIVQTPAQPNVQAFFQQRIRWSSKADKYDDKKLTWILAIVYFFNLNFLAMFIAGCFQHELWLVAWCLIVAKTIVELIFLYPVASFYHKRDELWVFPLLQPLHIAYVISAGFLGKFGSYQWKGRRVK